MSRAKPFRSYAGRWSATRANGVLRGRPALALVVSSYSRWTRQHLRVLCVLAPLACAALLMLALLPPEALASTSWATGVKSSVPAGANAIPSPTIGQVSCASAGNCSAVGTYTDSSYHRQGLLLTETSGKWATAVEVSLPAGANASPSVALNSLSCTSAGNCTAVGNYFDSSSHLQGLILTETSGTWATGVEVSLPAGAGTSPNVSLPSVSCVSAGNCTAVGFYTDSSSYRQGLLLTETSGTWAAISATLPANGRTSPSAVLLSVSCASATNCSAVGYYNDGSFHRQGLLLTETAGTWATAVETSLPAGANTSPQVSLSSVSCASVGNCSTVGFYTDSSGYVQGLLLTEIAGTWATGVETSLPAGANASPAVSIGAVSCASVGNCSAVGYYTDSSGYVQGLLLTETAGTWATAAETSLPAGANSSPAVSIGVVSCASVGNCSAVGSYNDSSAHRQGLLLTETSGTWATGVEASLPAGANASPVVSLGSVSCASAGNCNAVGYYTDSSGNMQGLLVGPPFSPTVSVSAPASGTAGSQFTAASISASLAGGSGPTGTITFTVFGPQTSAPTTCTSGGMIVGTASVSGNGAYNPSASFTPTTAGSYWWYATYGGDSNNLASTSTCSVGMPSTAVRNATSLTAGGPSSDKAGTAISSSAISSVFSGATINAGGTITFTVFGPQPTAPTTCTSGGTTVGTAAITGAGIYTSSASFTPTTAGSYWWYANYAGDANNNSAVSSCGTGMPSTAVSAASTSLTANAPAAGTAGNQIAASSISGSLAGGAGPTGTITFIVFGPQTTAPTTCAGGGTTVGTAAVTGAGTYTPNASFTPTTAGSYWWYATYGGDGNNLASTSTCGTGMPSTTVKNATGLTAAGPSSDQTGAAMPSSSISSMLSGATINAGGTITFTVYGPQTTAPNNCSNGGTTIGTAAVTGAGSYRPSASFTPTTAGNYWWYATYGGDTSNNPTTSSCGADMTSTTVNPATTNLTASAPASGTAGTQITASSISASLTGGSGPIGTITFTVYGPQANAPTDCSNGGATVDTTSVSGNGAYNPTASFTPTTAGSYWWYATYDGDANNNPTASSCGAGMPSTTVSAATALTAAGPFSDETGTAISSSSISSSLSGATSGAGGTITFTVYGPQTTSPTDCSNGGTTIGTAAVTGAGSYTPSTSFTPTTAGTYWWYANYGGDNNNLASTSTCGSGMPSTTVRAASTSLTATAPANGTAGTQITAPSISASLTGGAGATGTITFTVYGPQTTAPTDCSNGGTTVDTTSVSGNGTYNPSVAFTPTTAGSYWWYASYGGDANNLASTSTCGSGMPSTTVNAASTNLTATAPANGTAGTQITASSISATLTGGSGPTGTITFTVFGPQTTAPTDCSNSGTTVDTTNVSGNGTYNPSTGFAPTTSGTYWWYATYGGDANNNPTASSCGADMPSTAVNAATTSLTTSGPASGTAGTQITASSISATLTGGSGPTGTITFTVYGPQTTAPTDCSNGGATVDTTSVSGNGTYNPTAGFTPETAGSYWWYATYGGDANNNPTASSCGADMPSTTVNAATTSLTANAPAAGTAETQITASSISATLTGGSGPTGTITFTVYGPQTTAPTDCSNGGTTVDTTSVSGNGTYNPTAGYTPTTAGSYWWLASYGGDSNNNPAASSCGADMSSTTVSAATTNLTANAPATGTAGTQITAPSISASLTGGSVPTGTITFTVYGPQTNAPTDCSNSGTTIGTAAVTGAGTYNPSASFTPTTAGSYWWYATYGGDSNNLASTSTCGTGMPSTTVNNLTTLTATGPSSGETGTAISSSSINSMLSGATIDAGGTITFTVYGPQTTAPNDCSNGGTTIGTAAVTGAGIYAPSASFTPTTAGSYWWYANYNGDSDNLASTSTCGSGMPSTTVSAATTSLTANGPASGTAGTQITDPSISASLTGGAGATGTITFTVFGPQTNAPADCSNGGTVVDITNVSGNGTYNPSAGYTPETAGNYWWYANYNGDSNNNPAASSCGAGMPSTTVNNLTTLTATGPSSGETGTAISSSSISSSLSGATIDAGGTITFTVYGPQANAPTDCSNGGTTIGTAAVTGAGIYNPSASFTPTMAGSYWWYANYSGDSDNLASTSTCDSGMPATTVSAARPNLTANAPATGTAGTQITAPSISASLTGGSAPTGTITFTVYGPQTNAPTDCSNGGTTVDTTSVSGNGTYNPTAGYTPTTAGSYWWLANYNGDSNNNPTASSCGADMASTTVKDATALTAAGPSYNRTGTAISPSSISSMLSGATIDAGGTITFTVFGPQTNAPTDCSNGGTVVDTTTVSGNGTYNPSASFTPTTAGSYWWYATYGGDDDNNPAASSCGAGMPSTTVGAASTSLTANAPTSGTAGTQIAPSSISGSLAGGAGPTGMIAFTVFGPQTTAPTICASGGTVVDRTSVSGNGTYNPSASFTPMTAGTYWWYATYGGDSNNLASTSTCGSGMPSTTVGGASTNLTANASASGTAGTQIAPSSISATLAGGVDPTGTITFTVFGPQTDAPADCSNGGTVVDTTSVSGNGTYNPSVAFTPTTAGSYWWYATYGGDANNNPTASSCGAGMPSTTVKNATGLTASGPATGTAGTAITAGSLSSSLSGATSGAGGAITFTVFGPQTNAPTDCSNGGTVVDTTSVSGDGTYNPSASFTPTTAGRYWWYSSYTGDANNSPTASSCGAGMPSTTVSAASTNLTATAPATGTAGTQITASSISASLTGGSGPTGTITFTIFGPQSMAPADCSNGGRTVDTTSVSGNGTDNPTIGFTPTTSGTYWWYATYGGDATTWHRPAPAAAECRQPPSTRRPRA